VNIKRRKNETREYLSCMVKADICKNETREYLSFMVKGDIWEWD